jgi:hypothetical protein
VVQNGLPDGAASSSAAPGISRFPVTRAAATGRVADSTNSAENHFRRGVPMKDQIRLSQGGWLRKQPRRRGPPVPHSEFNLTQNRRQAASLYDDADPIRRPRTPSARPETRSLTQVIAAQIPHTATTRAAPRYPRPSFDEPHVVTHISLFLSINMFCQSAVHHKTRCESQRLPFD